METEPETARWLVDLLDKLGRESDAYDAVGLIIPIPTAPDATSEEDPGRLPATMCNLVLDRTPINFHREARALRPSAP